MIGRAVVLGAVLMPAANGPAGQAVHCGPGATTFAGREICARGDRTLVGLHPDWAPPFRGATVNTSVYKTGETTQVGFIYNVDAPLHDVIAFYAARFRAAGGGTEIRRPASYLAIAGPATLSVMRRPWEDGRNEVRIEVTMNVSGPSARPSRTAKADAR